MQAYIIWLLVVALTASVVAFCVMGARQRRRRCVLKEACSQSGLEFIATDIYDLPLRFSDMALIGSGHSRRADNVADGHMGEWQVYVFDFHYEVGHGMRRATRYYSVAAVELTGQLDAAVMWHERDRAWTPLAAIGDDGMVDQWSWLGSEVTTHKLADVCAPLADLAVSMQVERNVLLLCCPLRGQPDAYARLMSYLPEMLAGLAGPEHTAPGDG